MKDWEYTFDPVSKAEWIRQIETDLRQKSVDTLSTEWWPGENLNPILHHEDLGDEIVHLPDHLYAKPPLLIEKINIENTSPEKINQKILEALQFGAQSILIQAKVSDEYFNLKWLANVIPDIITFQIEFDVQSSSDFYKILQNTPEYCLVRFNRSASSGPLAQIPENIRSKETSHIDRLRFVYSIGSGVNLLEEISVVLKKMLEDLEQWKAYVASPEIFFSKCILRIHPDADYFKHIILIRTLYLLWNNLLLSHGVENNTLKSGLLETHIAQNPDEEPDLFLIRASMSGLAASLAGTSALCINGLMQENGQDFYSRINRNIHHLLQLESGMYKGKDPLAGSFAIDFHTKRWVNKVWNDLTL